MPSPLFLVESSAKAASLTDLLSQKIDTLIVENVPIEVKLPPKKKKEKDGRPFLFHAIPQEKEIIDHIVLHHDRDLYFAFDDDQQGEHWSWMIREFIADNVEGFKEPKRLYINGMTEEDIQNSLKSISENNYHEGLTYEIKARFDNVLRDHFKRLTGSEKVPGSLSLSFSAITFLFFLSDREDEIQRFSPLNKGQIVVKLTNGEGEFEARLRKASDVSNDGLLKNKDEFEKVKSLLTGKDYSVKSICRSPKKIHPPSPFNTVNLIQEAYLQLEMDPEKTLSLARELFHGAEIDGRNRGLISFFITENTDLPEDVSNIFREYLSRDQKGDAIGSCQIMNKDGDLPIIPLMPDITPEHVIDNLDQEAVKLYELIRNRALASQMDDALVESIEVVIQAGDECIFIANKLSVIKKGYLTLYHNEKEKDMIAGSPITDLQEGQVLNRVKAFVEATSGVPPEYYTLESIFTDLAEMGMSISSEMAVILKEMLQLDYLKIASEGTLHPNENCPKLVKLVHSVFPTMSGLNLSAYFKQTVDEVISGRKDFWEALSQFDQILHMHGKKVETHKIFTHKAEQIQAHQKASPTPDISQKQHSRILEEESSGKPSIERASTKESQIKELESHEFRSKKDHDLHKGFSPDHVEVSTKAEVVDFKKPESIDETVPSVHIMAPFREDLKEKGFVQSTALKWKPHGDLVKTAGRVI
ncbi:MAG: DNA topoisomerase, partial [Thermodesulfobacteriota bacterium]|nr:DNA topoisomerase [Thermodesulfobacteriota bacterium]